MLQEWKKPFLTAFGDQRSDYGRRRREIPKEVPGAHGQPHTMVKGAGHFIQETHGAGAGPYHDRLDCQDPADGLTDFAPLAPATRP